MCLEVNIADPGALGFAGWDDTTWMEVLLRKTTELSMSDREDMLPGILDYQQKIALRMSTHMSLTCENIARSTWLSAGMLNKNPKKKRKKLHAPFWST